MVDGSGAGRAGGQRHGLACAREEIVISPRPLEAALMELTRQSGSNILFLPGSMAGLTSRPVRARGWIRP